MTNMIRSEPNGAILTIALSKAINPSPFGEGD